ncbi:MAG: SPOR domain-containing protein [Chromatiales bacterium]|nr:SPOR domain-containing protein [Chromatiales bacterium]
MRIIIILLLAVNFILVGFNYFVIEPGKKSTISERPRGDLSLVLLSELKEGQLKERQESQESLGREDAGKQLVPCLKVVGDWDIDRLELIKEQLIAKEKRIISEGKERRKKVNYWVVIPPFESRQEAITAKRQLQNEKIIDSFIIKSGARANALSLGLYSNEAGALRRAKFVNEKNVGIADAAIEELTLYVDRYWLKLFPVDNDEMLITTIIGNGILDTKQVQCEIDR